MHHNVLTFQLVMGVDRYFIIGVYIAPRDLETLDAVQTAWNSCPKGCKPLLIGDLNMDLLNPQDERDETIAKAIDFMDFLETSRHFCQPRKGLAQGRWTWRMCRMGQWMLSNPDCFLGWERSWKQFRKVILRMPRHHDTDHQAVVATIFGGKPHLIKRYRRQRQRYPILLPCYGPRTAQEMAFKELKSKSEPLPLRKRPTNSWISDQMWKLIDDRAQLWKRGCLTQQLS